METTVTLKLSFRETVNLAHDILMSGIHPTPEKDERSLYQVRLLAHIFASAHPSGELKSMVCEELCQVWGELQISRMLKRLEGKGPTCPIGVCELEAGHSGGHDSKW